MIKRGCKNSWEKEGVKNSVVESRLSTERKECENLRDLRDLSYFVDVWCLMFEVESLNGLSILLNEGFNLVDWVIEWMRWCVDAFMKRVEGRISEEWRVSEWGLAP